MPGVLLNTHVLYWLVSGMNPLTDEALVAIGESQTVGTLFVSPITAWELSIATRKPPHGDRPQLNSTYRLVSRGDPRDLGEGHTVRCWQFRNAYSIPRVGAETVASRPLDGVEISALRALPPDPIKPKRT